MGRDVTIDSLHCTYSAKNTIPREEPQVAKLRLKKWSISQIRVCRLRGQKFPLLGHAVTIHSVSLTLNYNQLMSEKNGRDAVPNEIIQCNVAFQRH